MPADATEPLEAATIGQKARTGPPNQSGPWKAAGKRAFMTGGHLTVGVYGGRLIARIGAQDMDAAAAEPGVRPFDMTGQPMRGIVVIDSVMLDGKALDRWVGQARSYVASLPPK